MNVVFSNLSICEKFKKYYYSTFVLGLANFSNETFPASHPRHKKATLAEIIRR